MRAGHLPVVEVLLDCKADVDKERSRAGVTAYHLAALNGRTDILEALGRAKTTTGSLLSKLIKNYKLFTYETNFKSSIDKYLSERPTEAVNVQSMPTVEPPVSAVKTEGYRPPAVEVPGRHLSSSNREDKSK